MWLSSFILTFQLMSNNSYVFDLVLFSATSEFSKRTPLAPAAQREFSAMLLYSTILKLFQEIELMWLKRISLPTILYALARYATLLNVGLLLVVNLLPMTVVSPICFTMTNHLRLQVLLSSH